MAIKKWLSVAFISTYLFVMAFGIFSHTTGYKVTSHPAMYYIVWDMFCGWSAYSTREHVIAEGVSGDFYRVTPAPWGSFRPFGSVQREHYDSLNHYAGRIAMNTLAHTEHEEIARVFVVEEAWAKKFNLPDHVWNAAYNEPKDVTKYYYLVAELTADGTVQRLNGNWLSYQAAQILVDNPRLTNDKRKSRPLLSPNPTVRASYLNLSPSGFPLDMPSVQLAPNAE